MHAIILKLPFRVRKLIVHVLVIKPLRGYDFTAKAIVLCFLPGGLYSSNIWVQVIEES